MTRKKYDDPYAEREAARYENPIPSRELILEFLKNNSGPAGFQEIVEGLYLDVNTDSVPLSRRLKAMERDGQVLRNRKGQYGPVDKLDLVTGCIEAHRDGFGFFVPDQGGDNWFVSAREMRQVFHGERVVARARGYDSRGRTEARIVEVLEADQPIQLVGRYFEESGICFVTPSDTRFTHDLLIPQGASAGAKQGQVVVARVLHRPKDKVQAVAAVVQVLGDYLAPGMEIEMAIHNYGIRHEWPDEVLQQLNTLPNEVNADDRLNRVDLRHLPLVTIDGEDARDFDDAVYCEPKKSGGWRLWVAIADVSYYVQSGQPLDQEAELRGNSVYFPEYVVPMLPEPISNGLCSLNPKVDRLCMVCELTVSSQGKLSGHQFYPAVMHSNARLTYNQVWAMLEGDQSAHPEYQTLIPHLENLYSLYQARATERRRRGAMEFESTETRIVFTDDRKIETVVPVTRNDAHKIIEECMICANVAAARFFTKRKIPGMYRVHEGPSEKKLEDLRSYLAALGLLLMGGTQPTPKDFTELMQRAKQRPDAEDVQTMLLRSMNQAIYSPDNQGHFGLAFTDYTHFTSPIRRYPDLLVHRLIKQQLMIEKIQSEELGAQSYSFEQLSRFGEICSATERNADMATREVIDWLKCEFMSSHIGETFAGQVVAVTQFGLFVRLTELPIEGLLHITGLGKDYFHFDQATQSLLGEKTGMIYRLGDPLQIVVARVSLEERKIDFDLAAGSQPPVKKASERQKLFAMAKRKTGYSDSSNKGRSSSSRPKKSTSKKTKVSKGKRRSRR